MTRTTQRNIIRYITPIFFIDVRPLDKSWSFVCNSALLALSWFSKFSSNPKVESSITNFVTLPLRMFFSRVIGFFVVFRSVKSSTITTFRKFLIPYFRITPHRTKRPCTHLRRRKVFGDFTFVTIY